MVNRHCNDRITAADTSDPLQCGFGLLSPPLIVMGGVPSGATPVVSSSSWPKVGPRPLAWIRHCVPSLVRGPRSRPPVAL